MAYPTPEWVANRVAALHAWINEESDANDWLAATGLDRPYNRPESSGQWITCPCPYCGERPLVRKGDLV